MKPPMPSATPTWHNDTYAAISPGRAELSAEGKTVVITGAGGTIGGETAVAFAQAHAKHIVLLGRDETALQKTQQRLPSDVESSCYKFDITNEEETKLVASKIGTWDILIMCAGYMPDSKKIEETSSDDWWRGFETNIKGTYNTVKAFIPSANSSQASIIGVTTGGVMSPAPYLVGLSSYIPSKLAQGKLLEFVGAEYPHIFTANIHPGCIESAIFKKSGIDSATYPMDAVQLPAHTIVWLASPEAHFLTARTVWANWDMAELAGQKDEITQGTRLTSGNFDFPYPYMG